MYRLVFLENKPRFWKPKPFYKQKAPPTGEETNPWALIKKKIKCKKLNYTKK